jgi:hypothetical protein
LFLIGALIPVDLRQSPRLPTAIPSQDWASKAVLGERYWLARKTRPIPAQHARAALVLSVLSGLSLIPLAYGLWALNPWAAFLGAALASMFKLWFCDRMAWLAEDMAKGALPDSSQQT